MNQVAVVVGMETMQGTSIVDSHLPRLPLLNVHLLATETEEEIDYIGPLLSWKGQQFILRSRHILGMGLPFPAFWASEPLSEGFQSV